jgi:hypothetical protein
VVWAPPSKVGDTDPTISAAKAYLRRFSYGKSLDTSDVYTDLFGLALKVFAVARNDEIARGVKQIPTLNTVGVYDWAMKVQLGIIQWAPPPPHRKIWIWTAPGSGADWNVGPSFDLGEYCRTVLNINHQPLSFEKGGYLGLLGGDPTFSYVDVTYDEYLSLLHCLDVNPDVQEALAAREKDPNAVVDLEMWFSGYSQSADGMEDALEILFGDGGFTIPKTNQITTPGKYRLLRDRINGVVQFGNPSRQNGSEGGIPGYVPAGWGIARKVRPAWLANLVHNITRNKDFYACTEDEIRPLFYYEIVRANISLPFFVHIINIAIPVIMNFIPIIGQLAPPIFIAGLAGISGLSGLLGGLMTNAPSQADKDVDAKLEAMLSPTGILTNIPGLLTLVGDLPGIQYHGDYWSPQPEFNGLGGTQVAMNHIAAFRR